MSQASKEKRWVSILDEEKPQEWEVVRCSLIYLTGEGASLTTGDYRWIKGKFEPHNNAPKSELDGYVMTHWLLDPKIWVIPDKWPDCSLEEVKEFLAPYVEAMQNA